MTSTPDFPAQWGGASQYAGSYNEPSRLARRFLPVVLFLLAIASVSLAIGIALEFGVWTHEEVIHGPFRTETGARDAWVPVGQASGNFPCCIGARTDDSGHLAASNLRAWLNGRELGPAHTFHDDIRSGKTAGYSHWQDNTVRFFIPESVANNQTASLRVRYPVQYSVALLTLNALMVSVLTVLTGFCGLASQMLAVLQVTFRAAIVGSAIIFPIYVVFLIAGYLAQQPIPATYLFRYLAIDSWLNSFEPYFPVILIVFAILLAGLNWGARDADTVAAATQAEWQTIDLWRRFGFFSTAGILYLFIAASAWSGHVSAQDVLEMNIGGFVPYSDAAGYFGGGWNYLTFGQIDAWNLRRPLAALFRSEIIAFGGLDFVGTVLVQAAALSFAIYWATNAIMKWRGVVAGLVFWAMAFILFRPFAITTMTEPLALFWSFCSIPFLLHGLQRESFPHLLVALAFLFVALFIRMGAMFVAPFIVLWAILYWGADIRQRLRNACAVLAVLLVILSGSIAFDKLYGKSDSELGGNFGSVLCGMSIGGIWKDCYTRFADELKQKNEAQQADFFYRTAAHNFVQDPRNFLRSMRNDLRTYLDDLYSAPTTWYRWPYSSKVLSLALYIISFAGWTYALRRSTNRAAMSFVIFVALGVLTSVPFTYLADADAKRVLYATNPLLALLIAGGFWCRGVVPPLNSSLKWRTGAVMLLVSTITAILLPFGLRAAGVGEAVRAVPSEFMLTQRVISGHSLQTGFAVLPDGAQSLPDVPSMSITKFREFITANGQIPANLVQMFPKPPFALVYPLELGRQDWDGYLFSIEKFQDKTVAAWKVKFTRLGSVQLDIARDLTPIKVK